MNTDIAKPSAPTTFVLIFIGVYLRPSAVPYEVL